jgi:predicted alpha/beta-fold hydrolase
MNGFKDAEDYWARASCKPFLTNIAIPTLLVSAQNDPFFAPECYPVKEAESNSNFFLEMPVSGGHVGFMSFGEEGAYWSERRMMDFFKEVLQK